MTRVEVIQGDVLKKGDTDPDLRIRLFEDDNDTMDVTGFTPTLRIRNTATDNIKVNTTATVADARNGILSYSWSAGDTDEAGLYEAEVSLDDGSGTVITFPNDSMFNLQVSEIIE